jgi:hypothetical protein
MHQMHKRLYGELYKMVHCQLRKQLYCKLHQVVHGRVLYQLYQEHQVTDRDAAVLKDISEAGRVLSNYWG